MSKEAKVAAGLCLSVLLVSLLWFYAGKEAQPVQATGDSLVEALTPAGGQPAPSPQPVAPPATPTNRTADAARESQSPDAAAASPERLTRLDAPRSMPDTAGASPGTEQHIVRAGDSLARIAELYYFRARSEPEIYLRLLQNANPTVLDPQALPANSVVLIPPDPYEVLPPVTQPVTLAEATRAPAQPRTADSTAPARTTPSTTLSTREYVVQRGDTFYGIAGKVLGTPTRWRELFELNRELVRGEPRNLRPGQKLRLPGA